MPIFGALQLYFFSHYIPHCVASIHPNRSFILRHPHRSLPLFLNHLLFIIYILSFLFQFSTVPILCFLLGARIQHRVVTVGTQAMAGPDLSLSQGMIMDASLNQGLYPSYATGGLGPTPFRGFQNGGSSSLGSKDPHSYDLFEPRPEIPFSKQPPKAVEDIYNAFPSVASIFPTWPFHIVEQPKSYAYTRNWYEEFRIKESRGHGKELSVERVHVPGTPAHRLLNSSSQASVREFAAEYEIFRQRNIRPAPSEDVPEIVRSTPYIFGTSLYDEELHNSQQLSLFLENRANKTPSPPYRCSICYFRPSHDSVPNWLYYTKDNDTAPRYYYCANCKAGDQWVELKSFVSLTGMVAEIAAICKAEDEVKDLGMEGVITSVPLAKFLRYEMMFEIELQAASVRRAIETEKKKIAQEEKRRLQEMRQMMSGMNFSYFGQTAARAIADRVFSNLEQNFFHDIGPLSCISTAGYSHYIQAGNTTDAIQEREDTEQIIRSNTPPGFPEGYLSSQATVGGLQPESSHTPPGRPSTPLWFTDQSKSPSPSSSARSSATFVDENTLSHSNDQYNQTAFVSFRGTTNADADADADGDFICSDENKNPGSIPGPSRALCYPVPSIRSGLYLLKTARADNTDHFKKNNYDGHDSHTSEDEPGTDFESDISDISEWDSDDSIDDSPQRLRCLDMLDQIIPPAPISHNRHVEPPPPPRVLRLPREEKLRYRRQYGVVPAVKGDLATIGEASEEEGEEPTTYNNKGKGRALA